MLWFCESICRFPACCARPEFAFGPTRVRSKDTTLEMQIIVNGVGPSRGVRILSLGSSCDPLGSFYEALGLRSEALRCRLTSEVQMCCGLENRAETSGFYSADFLSGSGMSAEPVVLSHVRDANDA